MPILTILLDSNEYIFGLGGIRKDSKDLLQVLASFRVKLPRFILDELHANIGETKLKALYRLIRETKIEVVEEKVPLSLVKKYQKEIHPEDAVIAAYCEFLQADVLISENRHFLIGFQPKSFGVLSAEEFLQQLSEKSTRI